MLLEGSVIGNQQDWANYITIADEIDNPILAWLPVGSKPVNVLHQYQVDSFDAPMPSAHVDGKDWDTFATAAKNRKELKARIQWVDKTAAVSKLAQDVTNAAGVADELAREITKKMKEMSRVIEATIACDQEAYEDDQVAGNQTRAIGNWIKATAQTVYPVDASYLTPSASIYSGTKANLNEDAIRAVLNSRFKQTGSKKSARLFCGLGLKSRFSDFQFYTPASTYGTPTANTARVLQRQESNDRLGSVVGFYQSDGGAVELEVDLWLAHANFGGTSGKADWRGYILNRDRWQLRWNQKPTTYKPDFQGGSYKVAMDAIFMLCCQNPLGEGKIDPSDA